MQPNLEQQDENAQLGQASEDGISRVDQSEKRSSEYDTRDELSNHRRLADLLGNCTQRFRRREQRDERQQEVGKRVVAQSVSGFVAERGPAMQQNLHLTKLFDGL